LVVISSFVSETTILGAYLAHVQQLLLMNAPGVSDQGAPGVELRRTFDIALTACLITFSCLEEETRRLSKKAGDSSEADWKETAKLAWKDETMNELLKQIHEQQTAMALLVQTLQMFVPLTLSASLHPSNCTEGNPFRQATTFSPRTGIYSKIWSLVHARFEVHPFQVSRFQSPFLMDEHLVLFWMEVRLLEAQNLISTTTS
jgi:hypothetical protein